MYICPIIINQKTKTMTTSTKIGDQITYTVELEFGKGFDYRHGIVIAIANKGDYKKILLDTGAEIYRAN